MNWILPGKRRSESRTSYNLDVFPTQMKDYLPFLFYDCGVHAFSYDCCLNSSKVNGKLNERRNNGPFRYPFTYT